MGYIRVAGLGREEFNAFIGVIGFSGITIVVDNAKFPRLPILSLCFCYRARNHSTIKVSLVRLSCAIAIEKMRWARMSQEGCRLGSYMAASTGRGG